MIFVCAAGILGEIKGATSTTAMIACHHIQGRLEHSEMTDLRPQRSIAQPPASGMSRFFSPANLDRYRQLASGSLGEAEQHRLLQALSEEMKAFKREARVGSVRHHAFKQNIDFQAGNQP
jgi:hypothetical protein